MKQLVRVAVFAIVSILMFSSCGGQESITADEATADTQAPVIEEPSDDNKLVTLEADEEVPEGPQSIVSLSPTATEMLFAIGAGSPVSYTHLTLPTIYSV